MENGMSGHDVVDPEVRAYVFSLVSALGGASADDEGAYVLGDDALACLKDLKRWIRFYDEKTNRLDVARCLAEANLVNGDLLPILAQWPEDDPGDGYWGKIALACLELLVPLTWPVRKDDLQITVNHHRHIPYLRLAHVFYKRAILSSDKINYLRTIVRIALPSLAQPYRERSNRNEGIIKLALYFFRNIASIAVSSKAQAEGDANEASRSASIKAFDQQDVFHLLLTLSSSISDDFMQQDVVVLEALFYLIKGIDPANLFLDDDQAYQAKNDELKQLLQKEAGMLRGYAKSAPTRHNRFGTMLWIKRDDERMSTVSGQDVLLDGQRSLVKMDNSKKWKKPKQRSKNLGTEHDDFDTPVKISRSAAKALRGFVNEFLDSGFNPLFYQVRKTIDREESRVLDEHSPQFFYTVSWFLEAERARRKASREKAARDNTEEDVSSFTLVASVFTQEMFIALNRFLQQSYDKKEWQDLNAGVRCFIQILHTIQEMSESPHEEDQNVAENIQNRIFYEETTHDRVVNIVQYYSNQGFGYLNNCTELAHVFLRMLERYSKQNVEMQVRSRRRARRQKKPRETEQAQQADEQQNGVEGNEEEEIEEARKVSRERSFDFKRFASRFMRQGCIDAFVALTRYYQELSDEQLKRAHRFFHRAAFKMEMSVMLFRIDIVALFYKMIKGPEEIDCSNPMHREWTQLVQHIFRQLTKKMQRTPILAVEMLFSKIHSTTYFLEHGFELSHTSKTTKRKEKLQIKSPSDRKTDIGIVVFLLRDQAPILEWMMQSLSIILEKRKVLEDVIAEGRSSEDSEKADMYDSAQEKLSGMATLGIAAQEPWQNLALASNPNVRLLLELVGFRVVHNERDQAEWFIPPSVTSTDIDEATQIIRDHQANPPQYGDSGTAGDLVEMVKEGEDRHHRPAFINDESEGEDDQGEEDFLFPAGGPTTRKSDQIAELKKRRRRRRRSEGSDDETGELTEEQRKSRAEARRLANEEKRRKIKSDLFVHDSDEDDDEDGDQAFFAKEEQRRKDYEQKVLRQLDTNRMPERLSGQADAEDETLSSLIETPRKRKASLMKSPSSRKRREMSQTAPGSELSDEENSSPRSKSSSGSSARVHDRLGTLQMLSESSQNHDDTPITSPTMKTQTKDNAMGDAAQPVKSRRGRAGFIIESDSENE